jgi:hypothetical protein
MSIAEVVFSSVQKEIGMPGVFPKGTPAADLLRQS